MLKASCGRRSVKMPKLAFAFLFLLALAGLANAQHAEPDRPIERDDQSKGVPSAAGAGQQTSRADSTAQTAGSSSICAMIESAAVANDLPFEFFARVIWQESRLKPDAIGPVTRSGRQAQGIAQFMPMTAAERLLRDPFDPVQALPKSAEFLRELRAQFGNLGLAAAAYNAGPQRVRDWLGGTRTLPGQTRNYVLAVTGTPADNWGKSGKAEPARRAQPPTNCNEMIALLRQAPNPFVEKLEERITLVAAKPWGVQLSAGFSRDRALSAYAGLARRYGAALAGRDPSLLSTTLRSRGSRPFYQVRVGTDTRESAND